MALGIDDKFRRLTKDLEMLRFADQPNGNEVGVPVTKQGAPVYTPNISTDISPSASRDLGFNKPNNRILGAIDTILGRSTDRLFGGSPEYRAKQAQLDNQLIDSQNAATSSVILDKNNQFLGSTRNIPTILKAQNDENLRVISRDDYKTLQANQKTLDIIGRNDINPNAVQDKIETLMGGDVLKRNNNLLAERYQTENLGYFLPRKITDNEGRQKTITPSSGFDLSIRPDIELKYLFQGDYKLFNSGVYDYSKGGRASANDGTPSKTRTGVIPNLSQFAEENFFGGIVPDSLVDKKFTNYRTTLMSGYNELKGALAKDVGERSQVAGLDLVKQTLPDVSNSIELGVSNAKTLLPTLYNDFESLHKQMVTANKLGKSKPENWSAAQTEIYEAIPKAITLTKLILTLAKKEGMAVEEVFNIASNENQEKLLKKMFEQRFKK